MSSTSDIDDDGLSDSFIGDAADDYGHVDAPEDGAPRYRVPARYLAAVEIPAIVKDIDRAVRAFGRVPSLTHVSAFDAPSCAAPCCLGTDRYSRSP